MRAQARKARQKGQPLKFHYYKQNMDALSSLCHSEAVSCHMQSYIRSFDLWLYLSIRFAASLVVGEGPACSESGQRGGQERGEVTMLFGN